MTYTAAQLLAFAWLPEGGDWRDDLAAPWYAKELPLDLMNVLYDGRAAISYRLTVAGIAERERLVKEGLIE